MSGGLDLILPEPRAASTGLIAMDAAAYHADPCDTPSLSSSIAKLMLTSSPAHARIAHPKLNPNFETSNEDKFGLGTVAHELLLEGDSNVVVVDAADWRTKDAKDARELARADGKTALLAKDWERVEQMANAARRQLEMFDLDPAPLTDGLPEQTLIWNEGDGVMCRARFDWIRDDYQAVDDLKTTAASADPRKWQRTMLAIGADMQAAFYLRGLRKAMDVQPVWRFIVQENYRPYALSVVTLSDDLLANAARRVDEAIELWRRCLADNHWPAYSRTPAVIDLPAWMGGSNGGSELSRTFGDALGADFGGVPF